MADHPVAPRACAANVSRRELLSGIASVPLAISMPMVSAEPSLWNEALSSYAAAGRACDSFLKHVLKPAYRRVDTGLALVEALPIDSQRISQKRRLRIGGRRQ